jgi:hypothetical protein
MLIDRGLSLDVVEFFICVVIYILYNLYIYGNLRFILIFFYLFFFKMYY